MTTIAAIIEEFLHGERPKFNTLVMTVHDDEEPDTRKFRVSDAGRCHLYQYWKRQGKEQPAKDSSLLKVMEMGNLVHSWLEYALQKSGVLLNTEILVEDNFRKGHADAMVTCNGHVSLYDFKTIGNKQAYYMLNNGAKAKREHQYQVLSYLAMMRDACDSPLYPDIKDARILYISREEVSLKNGDKLPPLTVIADVAADLDLLPAVNADWQSLIDAWDKQQDPTPTPDGQWECRYCPYSITCEIPF